MTMADTGSGFPSNVVLTPAKDEPDRIPWYDYRRGGLLDTFAIEPGQEQYSSATSKRQLCCCSGGGNTNDKDERLRNGPEPNNGLYCDPEDDDLDEVFEKCPNKLKRVLVVLNPFAGKGRGKRVMWPQLKLALTAANITYDLFETQRHGHAMEHFSSSSALQQVQEVDAILSIGGDGTVNEVANGLLLLQQNHPSELADLPPVGILPGGTGNSTLVSLGMNDPQTAMDAILRHQTFCKFDMARCTYGAGVGSTDNASNPNRTTTRYIFQLFGWGLGVDANIRAETMRWMGPPRYDVAAVMEILSGKQRQLHIRGTCEDYDDPSAKFELKGDYAIVMIMNCAIGGADMRLAPYAKINDGYFDMMAAKGRSRMELIQLFDELKRNGCHAYSKDVYHYRFKELVFLEDEQEQAEGKPVVLDGENCAKTPIRVKVIPRAFKIFVQPPKKQQSST